MREIFELFGLITVKGLEGVRNGLTGLEKQFDQAEKALFRFGKAAEKVGTTFSKDITAPLVALGAGMVLLADKTAKYSEVLIKMESTTGLSTDTLQEFQHVAKMTDMNFETISRSVQKFARQLPEIAKQSGPAYEMLKKLGISVFDASGNVRNINDLFPEMIKRIQQIHDPMTRLSLAQQIFGKGAAELGPILSMTGEQLDAMRKEAHDMGIVMSGESVKSAEAFGDQIDKLKEQANAMVMKLGMDFIPLLRDTILPIIQNKVIPFFQGMAREVKNWVSAFQSLSPEMRIIIIAIGGFAAAAGPMIFMGGKAILMIKELQGALFLARTATIALTASMVANPFAAAIIGATTLVGILITLNGLMDKSTKQIPKEDVIEMNRQRYEGLKFAFDAAKKAGQSSFAVMNQDGKMVAYTIEEAESKLNKLQQAYEKLNALRKKDSSQSPIGVPTGFDLSSKEKDSKEERDFTKRALKVMRDDMDADAKARFEIKEKANREESEFTKRGLKVMRDDMDADARARFEKQQEEEEQLKRHNEIMLREYLMLGQGIGSSIASGIGEGVAGLKKALKGILETFLGFIERLMIEAIFANTMKNILTLTFGGLAKAAAEAMVITALFESAKKGVESFIESFGEGALVQGGRGGVIAKIGERRDDEIVMPMKSGIQALADGIVARIGSISPALAAPAFAGIGGPSAARTISLHIGTLIADDRGIKELERRLGQFRVLESQRRGAD